SRPMKCQRKASPYSACFRSRSCARFSPTTVTPASTSAAISASATYFVAATIVTELPICAWMPASRARISSGESTDHALGAALTAAPSMGEEQLRMTARAEIDPVDTLHARRQQCALGRQREIEPAVRGEIVVEAGRHVVADLV